MSEPFELLLLEQCYEIELDAIVGVEKVEFLNSSSLPPIGSKKFFCRYRWLPNLGSLVSVEFPKPISESKLPPHKASSLCRTCKAVPPDLEWLTDPKTGEILLGSDEKYSELGIIVKGVETYKLWDYVRICRHGSPDKREDIGQIIEICGIRSKVLKEPVIDLTGEGFRPPENLQATLQHKLRQRQVAVTVRLYSRERWAGTKSEDGSNLEFHDNRRLWFTNETEVVNVLNGLAGHCKVIHFFQPGGGIVAGREKDKFTLDELRKHENVFYTILPSQSEQELICFVPTFESHELPFISHPAAIKSLSSEGELTMKDSGAKKLRHLELFGGIGSMSVAFMEAGLTEQQSTCFVDWSIPACETVSKNFPKSTVICCDVHDLLSFMVDGKTCEGNNRLQDLRTQKWIERDRLPKPGEVDLITAGFPCGSHSTLNVIRQGKDMKNALCATALSFVEYLRPDYVYFENVRGLVKSQLQDLTTQETLQQAFLRLICGTLMTLNYQFNFGILQAAQYGTPQERRRIIFSAARRGLTVPKLPQPTHHFRDPKLTIKLTEHPKLAIDFRGHWGGGALKPVTVSDAIADLPCFEYFNPKLIMKDFSQKTRKVLKRRARLIPLLSGSYLKGRIFGIDYVGFSYFKYLSPPKNNYQLNLRVKRGTNNDDHRLIIINDVDEVFNWHITGLWSDRILEMIWHIPLKANADHCSLPKPLQWKEMNSKVIEKKKSFTHRDFEGNFGRLGQSGQFKTLITKMDPRNQGKCGQVLHPTQHRTLTVLEAQRAQGFPDWFKLSSGDEGVAAMYKQIGNAIPIPICSALANSLWSAREIDWIKLGKPINFNNLENELLGLIDLYIDNLN
ncbi:hypothetical protein CROQUDRAFT_131046 [Cronartium quercuum f. sp. fusiforme G11]|uniref:DNA (cytosine-5-)-methyltransferase n=1 Tax=Cronartium quercuum f. sp. fusiforme G11 TaxID=708437 RepID=A0A9P6TES4_9BASI|nr:hypothetical protein CROQUDRAFT_131046 [Cronartium quercuum f. sp. fusiforme G11]